MSTYAFETITAAQALAITADDTLTVSAATGSATSGAATFADDPSGFITLTYGGRSVVFGAGISALAAQPGHLAFDDGSLLYIGDGAINSFDSSRFSASAANLPTAAFGGASSDTLRANGPHVLLQGNAGGDILVSGSGDDTIYGGQGDDSINTGGAGSDFGQGNKGNDTIVGGGGNTLLGGQGDDSISGGGILDGNLGDDSISGSGQLIGEGGNDVLVSVGGGADTLNGGDGNDSLVSGSGADSITGDAGADTISIAGGVHIVSGGAGADVFLVGPANATANMAPMIVDWTSAEDKIHFVGLTANASNYTTASDTTFETAAIDADRLVSQNHFTFVAVQVGHDVLIFAGGSAGITAVVGLAGRSLNDFDPHNNLI